MPHLPFEAAQAEQLAEPITFELTEGGRTWSTVPEVEAGVVFDLADLADAEDAAAFVAFRRFLLGIIDPEQRAEFEQAVRTVTVRQLMLVTRRVLEAVTAGPFDAPSSSPAPAEPAGEQSNTIS